MMDRLVIGPLFDVDIREKWCEWGPLTRLWRWASQDQKGKSAEQRAARCKGNEVGAITCALCSGRLVPSTSHFKASGHFEWILIKPGHVHLGWAVHKAACTDHRACYCHRKVRCKVRREMLPCGMPHQLAVLLKGQRSHSQVCRQALKCLQASKEVCAAANCRRSKKKQGSKTTNWAC